MRSNSSIQTALSRGRFNVFACTLAVTFVAGCAQSGGGSGSSARQVRPMAEYCGTAKSISGSTVTVSGKALYQYRKDGNGAIAGEQWLFPDSTPAYGVTINSVSKTCLAGTTCTQSKVPQTLADAINADATLKTSVVARVAASYLVIAPLNDGGTFTLDSTTRFTAYAGGAPRPIRYAEVRVLNSAGSLVQCGETDASGNFSVVIPQNTGGYSVEVSSRSSNASNTAFVMTNPYDNDFYTLPLSVGSSSNSTGNILMAKASGDLKGAAFNILDQIANAQIYLRAKTANCNVGGSANYFQGCEPFTTAPVVYAYWTAGLSPGVYIGKSGGLSFYLHGKRELYILGGVNGNTTVADMDHFDNAIIVHEYAHFLEDQMSRSDSPGGSHDGDSIIDPRLSWSEGFADFFQGAVSMHVGTSTAPRYRDTSGVIGCGSVCTSASIDEDISSNSPTRDNVSGSQMGEGTFREFSVARALYNVAKSGSAFHFSEIWTGFAGSGTSMKTAADRFKTISRFHLIQIANASSNASNPDWTTIRNDEKQRATLLDYGSPIAFGSCASKALSVRKETSDDGSFVLANQFRNNDFYNYAHAGGSLSVQVQWTGSDMADLDLYVYREGYTFGNTQSMAASANAETKTLSGSETISTALPAGNYMINVMAYTGIYGIGSGTYATSYQLTINGQAVCSP